MPKQSSIRHPIMPKSLISHLYIDFLRCDYYSTDLRSLQENPLKNPSKNYTKTELWKLVIFHSSALCAICQIAFPLSIQIKQLLNADRQLCRCDRGLFRSVIVNSIGLQVNNSR